MRAEKFSYYLGYCMYYGFLGMCIAGVIGILITIARR